ncbi:hypothetical protein P171DRAFT_507602, partial [Karstenula rhodostoma CBS 690.94]
CHRKKPLGQLDTSAQWWQNLWRCTSAVSSSQPRAKKAPHSHRGRAVLSAVAAVRRSHRCELRASAVSSTMEIRQCPCLTSNRKAMKCSSSITPHPSPSEDSYRCCDHCVVRRASGPPAVWYISRPIVSLLHCTSPHQAVALCMPSSSVVISDEVCSKDEGVSEVHIPNGGKSIVETLMSCAEHCIVELLTRIG